MFNRIYSWVADAAAGIDITASRMDADTNNITTNGFGNCLTRDGQGSATANQPMNGLRHTGVGNGQAATDYLALGQFQSGEAINWSIDSGVADALAVTYTPALASLTDGQLCFVRAAATNLTTTPTFNPNALGAHTITKIGGNALDIKDIKALQELILRYNVANTRWELLNPRASFNPNAAYTNWVVAGGTSDVITATFSSSITALSDGMLCGFRASAANTTATPTFNPSGLGAATITKEGGAALIAGDIPGALAEVLLRYNLAHTRWELINPVNPPVAVTLPTRQVLLSGSSATYTTPASCRQIIVRFIGGGGGGGGLNGGSNGGTGGTTSFNSVTAIGGTGGGAGSGVGANVDGGAGGTGGTGSASIRVAGSKGGGSSSTNENGNNGLPGGTGGSGIFGGGAGQNSAGIANTGAGGGGGSKAATAGGGGSGAGGGAGEYVELIIPSPAGTYTYTVGAAGSGGGNAGGTGIIIVDETY